VIALDLLDELTSASQPSSGVNGCFSTILRV
jgi:hypothetical protein